MRHSSGCSSGRGSGRSSDRNVRFGGGAALWRGFFRGHLLLYREMVKFSHRVFPTKPFTFEFIVIQKMIYILYLLLRKNLNIYSMPSLILHTFSPTSFPNPCLLTVRSLFVFVLIVWNRDLFTASQTLLICLFARD